VAEEVLQIRVHGSPELPTLIYLPGTHGDWSLIAGLRNKLLPQYCFVEFTYPRTTAWTLDDYASHIREALKSNGLKQGWLLGESFGSQIAWLLASAPQTGFKCQGIILAGGFGRHPFPWEIDFAIWSFRRLIANESSVKRAMKFYAQGVRWFYEQTEETETSIHDFIQHRTQEDGLAAIHRLKLIRDNHPQTLVAQITIPVFNLSGFWDALVPWYLVTPWLHRRCSGYRGSKVISTADHNVLFSAPTKSARTIREWFGRVA
jgi:pimeloyl-ACP methyl ester carboxylesterase